MLPWSKQTLVSGRRYAPPPTKHKPHASGFYLSFTSQNISCGLELLVAPVSAAGGNLMMHLFTLCSVVLDPQQELQIP